MAFYSISQLGVRWHSRLHVVRQRRMKVGRSLGKSELRHVEPRSVSVMFVEGEGIIST